MAEHWSQNMALLKGLIIVMTTLLVAGLILLVVGMARTAGELGRGFGEARLELPEGARIVETTAAADRLFLRLEHDDGRRAILVVDLKTLRPLGLIRLESAP